MEAKPSVAATVAANEPAPSPVQLSVLQIWQLLSSWLHSPLDEHLDRPFPPPRVAVPSCRGLLIILSKDLMVHRMLPSLTSVEVPPS